MIAVIDYGVGNLFSLASSLAYLGIDCEITADKDVISKADGIILPGVGAFRDAYAKLSESGLIPVLQKEVADGKPLLGICLGMQLLFEKSYEYGECKGLGFLKGTIEKIPTSYKIPHMGWNALDIKKDSPLLKYIKSEEYVYYVHSYMATGCEDSLLATSEYGVSITGAVGKDNVFGTQFHPEKSGETGLKILKAFGEMKK